MNFGSNNHSHGEAEDEGMEERLKREVDVRWMERI
jgi:hypothetical protein